VSTPTPALESLEGPAEPVAAGPLALGGGVLPVPASGAFKVELELEKPESGTGEARILLQSGGKAYATVGYDFAAGKAFVARDGDKVAGGPRPDASGDNAAQDTYRQISATEGDPGRASVRLTAYMDRSSVEVFVDGGRQSVTSLVFPPSGDKDVQLAGTDGPVTVRSGSVTPLARIR
jgi:levanase